MGFSRGDIYELLREHKEKMGRCEVLRVSIKYVENLSNVNSDALIEEMVLRSTGESGIPTGSGISDPTSSIAIKVADKRTQIARSMGKDLEEMEIEFYEKIRDVGFVEGWLSGLKERERFVIEEHVINGTVWDRMPDLYMKRFPDAPCSLDGLRKMQKRAVKKIQKMSE